MLAIFNSDCGGGILLLSSFANSGFTEEAAASIASS